MCRLGCCQREDGLTGSTYYVPKPVWTRITKYYLKNYPQWCRYPAGRARIKRAESWFLSHIAKRGE